jgi:hypothetical protein
MKIIVIGMNITNNWSDEVGSIFALIFVENWDEELKKMNKHKNDHPYRYPETFIQFSGLVYCFIHLPYRQLRRLSQGIKPGFVPGLRSADYNTLWQRISNLELNVPIPSNDIVVPVDSTRRLDEGKTWR